MQLPTPDKLKKAILPGLFIVYIFATIIAFLFHAQYFNAVLEKTFAEPSFPDQVAVNLPALDHVARLIRLDQNDIAALTTSRPKSTAEETTKPTPAPPVAVPQAVTAEIGTSSATMTLPISATSTRSATTIKTASTTIRTTGSRAP